MAVISALIVAINMITVHCRTLKYKKRITLITNARGPLDPSDNASVAAQIRKEDIHLSILYVPHCMTLFQGSSL